MSSALFSDPSSSSPVVLPGQLIAVSHDGVEETSFLRGHGTYIEQDNNDNENDDAAGNAGSGGSQRLRASVTGTVERVNKLISVLPLSTSRYAGHVGDLVVGRVVSVGTNRWKIALQHDTQTLAHLPLSGVHLPDHVQRLRTAQDAREMRLLLKEGDMIAAEVHKVMAQDNTTLQLHMRSTRYGKLEQGCWVAVAPGRMVKRQNHYITNVLQNQFDLVLGCNGWIWMQRATSQSGGSGSSSSDATSAATTTATSGPELAEVLHQQRIRHAQTPYTLEERQALARLRNSVVCLQRTAANVTVEAIEQVYQASLTAQLSPADMLRNDHVLDLTRSLRP